MMSVIVKRSLLFLMIAVAGSSSIHALQLSERDQHAASQHFKRGTESLLAEKYDAFIEMSAHPVLRSPLLDGVIHAKADALVLGTLRRDEDELHVLTMQRPRRGRNPRDR